MCETEFFANSLLQIVQFKILHVNANSSCLFAKYVNNSHNFAKMYIIVHNWYKSVDKYL